MTHMAGDERGRWGLVHIYKLTLCSVSRAGPLKVFKESDPVKWTRLEEDGLCRVLQQEV